MQLIQDGQPVPALLTLARRHGIEASNDISALGLSEALSKHWLRTTEHQYQIPGGPPSIEDLALLQELNLTEAVLTPPWQYDGALILGATIVAVRKRLAYLVDQCRGGVAVSTIYLLGGARPLDPIKESREALCTPADLPFKADWTPPEQMPTTEAGMMELVLQQSQLPENWKYELVNTPLQPTPNGKTRHPNTADTAKEFLKTNPKPGTYLVVSSQPFIARQTINVRRVLPRDMYSLVGIGYAAGPGTLLKTFLDEIVRLLNEEVQGT